MRNLLLVILILNFIYSCSDNRKFVYEIAASNSAQLEMVIEHYSGDSLKKIAAEYLIDNMLHHYNESPMSIAYEKNVMSSNTVEYDINMIDSIWTCLGKSGISSASVTIYDAQSITAQYLIDNIDSAFRAWRTSLWGDSVSFLTFLNYILPYRVNDEPLCDWRNTLYDEYYPLVKNVSDPLLAFSIVYRHVMDKYDKINPKSYTTPSVMFQHHVMKGTCAQRTIYIVSVLRSLGIPASYDYVNFWGNYSTTGHAWVSLVNDGHTYTIYGNDSIATEFNRIDGESFNGEGELIHPYHEWDSIKRVPNVLRKCYSLQKNISQVNNSDVPFMLRDLFSCNVSGEYGFKNRVSVKCKDIDSGWLYAFSTGEGWRPISEGIIEDDSIVFKFLPGKIVYVVATYNNGCMIPIDNPFLLMNGNVKTYFNPDNHSKRTITLRRKFPLRKQWYDRWKLMTGTVVECSDYPDFRKKDTVYTFNYIPESIIKANMSVNSPFRYIRLKTPDDKRPEISELKFNIIGLENESDLKEDVISDGIPQSTVWNLFDRNYMTYASKANPGYWVGIDFNKNIFNGNISMEFCARHDMNMIVVGNRYELFFYNYGWNSLGTKTAYCDSLIYDNVPDNALLWLHNLSGGREERIFIYKNGKQIWY